jgi:hypothetical protein
MPQLIDFKTNSNLAASAQKKSLFQQIRATHNIRHEIVSLKILSFTGKIRYFFKIPHFVFLHTASILETDGCYRCKYAQP